jgi:transcriptional regulator with GAF, ATPase, and Fis domain
MTAWMHCLGETPESRVRSGELSSALSAAGIDLRTADAARPGVAGILLLGRPADGQLDELLKHSRGGRERILVVVIEEAPERDRGWHLLAAGASDVLVWDCLENTSRDVAERIARWHETDRLVESPAVRNNLIGTSQAWVSLLREVVEVACYTDATILITGESGTGKELIARLVHTLDPRPDKRDLVVLDCTTVVPELAGSEFFGHERGSYTGATGPREGAFAMADGGTLFLDEIGELPLPLQAQLLRAIQERTYKRVGGNTWHSTRFRLVSATNRTLPDEVAQGRFRRDLYHRLATWICRVPSLRERSDDILPLAEHFLAGFRPDRPCRFDGAVRDFLLNRDYPGNVRDLKQVVQRLCARHVGAGPITVGNVPADDIPTLPVARDWRSGAFEQGVRKALATGATLRDIGRGAEDLAVDIVIGEEAGSLQRAALRLGVTDRALQIRRADQRRKLP